MIEEIRQNVIARAFENQKLIENNMIRQKEMLRFIDTLNEIQSKTKDIKKEIKDFIDELENNLKVDEDNFDISAVSCDYVINRLREIIK